jgi:hypothetical protein
VPDPEPVPEPVLGVEVDNMPPVAGVEVNNPPPVVGVEVDTPVPVPPLEDEDGIRVNVASLSSTTIA